MTAARTDEDVRAWRPSLTGRAWVRVAIGTAILAAVVLSVGATPFVQGIASISLPSIAAAIALSAVATWAAAWRWRILAARLGIDLVWRDAVAAYYCSQFLNTVVPGGVVGDIGRAVSHGRRVGEVGQGLRAVAAERSAGQVVQLLLAVAVLVPLGLSAYAPAMGLVALGIVLVSLVVVVASTASHRARTVVGRELATVRAAFGSVGTVVGVIVSSTLVVAALVSMFAVACAAVGVDASAPTVIAVASISVLAGSIPLGIGGWGPREGAAAWAFAAVGLGSATGVAASTAYAVLAMIGVAPGAMLLLASAIRRRRGDAGELTQGPAS